MKHEPPSEAAPGASGHRYDYALDLASEPDSAAAHLLRMVGADKRVLELGAGPGSISRYLGAAGCRVVAVERDEAAVRLLAGRCERALALDLEADDWVGQVAEHGPYDVIMLADVLEHLVEP